MSGDVLEFSAADLATTAAAYDPARHEAPIVVGHANEVIAKYRALADEKSQLAELSARRAAIPAGQETRTATEVVEAQIRDIQRLSQAKQQEMQQALADLER